MYGQVAHWYGKVFFKQLVRGQVYIFEISPPLMTMLFGNGLTYFCIRFRFLLLFVLIPGSNYTSQCKFISKPKY